MTLRYQSSRRKSFVSKSSDRFYMVCRALGNSLVLLAPCDKSILPAKITLPH